MPQQAERGGAGDRVGPVVDAELVVRRAPCDRIVSWETNRRSPISPVDKSLASSRSTLSAASLGGSSSSPLDARPPAVSSSLHLVGERGNRPAVHQFTGCFLR